MTFLCALLALAVPQNLLFEVPKPPLAPVKAAGDIDQDGVVDFLVGPRVHSGVDGSLLLDLTDGDAGGEAVDGLGDFDGDGWPDVALMDVYGNTDVRSGLDGSKLLVDACADPPFCFGGFQVRAAGDVDGDGLADLVFSEQGLYDGGGVQVVLGGSGAVVFDQSAGTGGCSVGAYRGVAGPGDLDGDGLDDVVYGFHNDTIADLSCMIAGATVARSLANGVLWTLPVERRSAPIGDLDGDGRADVLTLDETVIEVLSGPTGSPLLSIPVALDPAFALMATALAGVGDVDCDGYLDFLIGDPYAQPNGAVWLYSGRDGSVLWQEVGAGAGRHVDGLGDVDGDGLLDFVVANRDFARVFSGAGLQLLTTYCSAKVNSQGCVPAIDAAGTAGLSQTAPFPISARQVLNQKPGLLFYGTSGAAAAPFQGGTLCVLPPLRRTPVSLAGGNPPPDDCSGAYLFDFNAWFQSGADPNLEPNQLVWVQFWMRDPNAADGTGVGLSDALTFPLCP